MKKSFLLLPLVILFFSCTNQGQHIKGKIEGGHGEMLYLYAFQNGEDVILDSTEISSSDEFDFTPHENLVKDVYRLGLRENDFVIIITDSSEIVAN